MEMSSYFSCFFWGGQVSDDEDDDERFSNPSTGSQNEKSNPSTGVKSVTKGIFLFFVTFL